MGDVKLGDGGVFKLLNYLGFIAYLEISRFFNYYAVMSSNLVKFSGQMDAKIRAELEAYAKKTGQKLSSIYNEMAASFLSARRVRPEVMNAIDRSLNRHSEIYKKLAE